MAAPTTDVALSTTKHDTTFSSARWRSNQVRIMNSSLCIDWRQFHDEDAADAGSEWFQDGCCKTCHNVSATPDATALSSIETAISGLDGDVQEATLIKALLDAAAAIDVADSDHAMYGGTVS